MSGLKDILAKLNAAVRAGEDAGDAVAEYAHDPFARVLLQQTRLATGQLRQARDMLGAAILQAGKKVVDQPQHSDNK